MAESVKVREIAPKKREIRDGNGAGRYGDPAARSAASEEVMSLHASVAEPVAKPARRPWVWAAVGAAAIAASAAGVGYYIYSLSFESTDDAFIEGHIVAVSARVSGHVAKVYVEDNQLVKSGDLLAQLDPSDFETRLAGAEAGLQMAKATSAARTTGVKTAHADWQQGNADLTAAEVREQRARSHLKRIESLVPQHAASRESLEEATATMRVAHADVTATREKINAKQSAIEQAKSAALAAEIAVPGRSRTETSQAQSLVYQSLCSHRRPCHAQERRGRSIHPGRPTAAGIG